MIVDWLEALPLAAWLRRPTPAYPLVNAAHILGIGLILGAILPLDLRLMGVFRAAPPRSAWRWRSSPARSSSL